MNMLNSLCVEGRAIFTKDLQDVEGQKRLDFILASSRFTKDLNGETVEVITEIPCTVFGNLAEVTYKNIKKGGRTLRLVGRLSGCKGDLFVTVEHVEYKLS